MNFRPVRVALTATAITASTATGLVLVAGPASADADPVTGGTVTVSVPFHGAFGRGASDIYVLPTAPASLSYDPAASAIDYSYPVTGGDASVNTFYGTLKLSGGLAIGAAFSHRTVVLSNFVFDIEDDTVSATVPGIAPATTPTTLVFFDAVGNHDTAVGPPETFTASDLQLDPAGAKYLDAALKIKAFKPGQHVGSFAASFTNSND